MEPFGAQQETIAAKPLPVVVRARRPLGGEALAALLGAERERLHEMQRACGAILFRGFGVTTAGVLARLMDAAGERAMRYVGGISPRTRVARDVYTSTELPPSAPIPLHNELSYADAFPRHVWFACAEPAAHGGETLLADARAVYRAIDPEVRERFERRGVRYTCSYHGAGGFYSLVDRWKRVGKSWMEALETNDPAIAEERCRALHADARWLPSGRLVLRTRRPAALTHPETNERVWFNQAHLFCFNPFELGWMRWLLARALFAKADTRPYDARYGDGGEIDRATLAHLHDVMRARAIAVEWQRGDVLWIDNVLCMHGRRPFRGRRRVLAGLTR